MQKKRAFTVVEIIVVCALIVLVFIGLVQILRLTGKGSGLGLSEKLDIQKESRQALLKVIQEIQEGIEVVKPRPGGTGAFLVLVDAVNRIKVIYQKKDEEASRKLGQDVYALYSRTQGYSSSEMFPERQLLKNIKRLTFTAHGPSAVLVNVTLVNEKEEYSVVTMIVLKNFQAEEEV